MSKKTSIIAVVLLIAAAVLFGLVLVNKGDGPVMGMMISDRITATVQDYDAVKASKSPGVYVVLEKEFNDFKEKFKSDIPAGKDLFANIHLVECPKGSKYTARWILDGKTVKEEMNKELTTNQQGIVSYVLEGSNVKSGSYVLQLYTENQKIFEYGFSVR